MLCKDMIQMMFLIWMSQVSFSEPSTHTKMHCSSLETKLLYSNATTLDRQSSLLNTNHSIPLVSQVRCLDLHMWHASFRCRCPVLDRLIASQILRQMIVTTGPVSTSIFVQRPSREPWINKDAYSQLRSLMALSAILCLGRSFLIWSYFLHPQNTGPAARFCPGSLLSLGFTGHLLLIADSLSSC